MEIGDRIKNRRKELGISADKLAEILNVSRATIYRYENGDIEKLPTSALELLAKSLKTSPGDLMGWKDNFELNNHEQKVIKHYRQKPEMQPAVDKLLGIEDHESKNTPSPKNFTPNIAAASGKEIKAKKLDIDTMIEIEKMK